MLLLLMRLQVEMSLLAIQVQTATYLEHKMGTTVQALLPLGWECVVKYFFDQKNVCEEHSWRKEEEEGRKTKKTEEEPYSGHF